MSFTSFSFLYFFVVVFAVNWGIQYSPIKDSLKVRIQNVFLLAASYYFYGSADWKMLPVLLVSTVVFWFIGIRVGSGMSGPDQRPAALWRLLGVILGIGLLLYFKYLNFFISSFADLFQQFGLHINVHTFSIIMPVGISFFTFRLISYVIEIYRGHMVPAANLIDFALYVSFFPCILSGPIDRPNKFVPQIQNPRPFRYETAVDGCRQILWGLFKKVVVADNCASFVNQVWDNIPGQCGSTLALSMVLYLFQMYADFSGYSDMAIGVGKLLGFRISDNFKTPLFALNIADYWKRWHITLTSWLTDYVFMPLNVKFRNLGNAGVIFAIVITFVLIGLWHGANWTFAVFGLYHGLLFIPLIMTGAFHKKAKMHCGHFGLPVLRDLMKMVLTFLLVAFGLILFRAESVTQALDYVHGMIQFGTFKSVYRFFVESDVWCMSWIAILMLVYEWKNRTQTFFPGSALCLFGGGKKVIRWSFYSLLLLMIIFFGGPSEEFVYFAF